MIAATRTIFAATRTMFATIFSNKEYNHDIIDLVMNSQNELKLKLIDWNSFYFQCKRAPLKWLSSHP